MYLSIGADYAGYELKQQLVSGARVIGAATAQDAVEVFLLTKFSGEEHHGRRLHKVKGIEQNEFK